MKARLLPLSPYEKLLEWLVECLPRRVIEVGLKPTSDIVAINERKGEYISTYAPSFEMIFPSESNLNGWYYLEAALVRNNGNREANIRIKIRDDDQESITIPIPTNLRGTVREVFFLPSNTTTLYWSPSAAPGIFSQSQLLIHKITSLESLLRRVYRVIFDLWRFRGRTPSGRAGLTWRGAVSNLHDAYQRTATLRIKRLLGNDYSTFVALNDTLKKADIRIMRKQVSRLPILPVISLIMPVQTPINAFFAEALDSVVKQIYPCWELVLIGDFSIDTQSHAIAYEYQSKYNQIKIILVKPGVDLAAAFNSALEKIQGKFLALINQHDQIPPHALFFVAQEINNHPDVDLIYTDDDSVDGTNKRFNPRFKPDWNPEMFFSYNYLAKLTIYRHSRILKLGGYRSGFEGAEDYDLSLRYLRETAPNKIRHIPKILYHSRAVGHSVISTPLHHLAHQSGKRALSTFYDSDGFTVEDGPAPGIYKINYPLPTQLPLVSIIIPTRDKVELLRKCIESIQQKTDYWNWEMLVVDNQSVQSETHSYFEQIQNDSRIKVLRYDKPFNYSGLNNYAVQYTQGEILALLNNDVEVIDKEWLSEMVSHAIRPGIGAVGAKLLYSNGMVQHAGVIIGLGGVAGHAHKYLYRDDPGYCYRAVVRQNLSAVTGACLVVKKSIYKEVGGLNAVELAVAFNDVDFCLKLLKIGYRNVFTPYARLYHHESMTRGHDDTPEKHAILVKELESMKRIWGINLQQDPAYNPNLTMEFEDFSLKMR